MKNSQLSDWVWNVVRWQSGTRRASLRTKSRQVSARFCPGNPAHVPGYFARLFSCVSSNFQCVEILCTRACCTAHLPGCFGGSLPSFSVWRFSVPDKLHIAQAVGVRIFKVPERRAFLFPTSRNVTQVSQIRTGTRLVPLCWYKCLRVLQISRKV